MTAPANAGASSGRGGLALLQGRSARLATLLIAIAFAVRVIPAAMIYGSDDVSSWLLVSDVFLRNHNPYETGTLNWPPLWPALILYSTKAAGVYHLPLVLSSKLTPILADTCIAPALFLWLV